MKTLLTLFVLLFSSSLVAEPKISDFSYLYEHPNSHYFFTCGAGKLNIFGGSSCGSYLGEQYEKLIKELKEVTGLKKINVEIYKNIEILDKNRSMLIESTEVNFDSYLLKIKKNEDKLDLNCKNIKNTLDQILRNAMNLKILKILLFSVLLILVKIFQIY